jgi:hypothetical protein
VAGSVAAALVVIVTFNTTGMREPLEIHGSAAGTARGLPNVRRV